MVLGLGLSITGCGDAGPTAEDGAAVAATATDVPAGGDREPAPGTAASESRSPENRTPATETVDATGPAPEPDLADMEPRVAERLRETRAALLANPGSAEAWGRFGMVAHAHELWQEARTAYQRAERLDRGDERWPYYLGDVLSVIGTDLGGAAHAFRRALELRPGYAPAHMRLGRVLVADGRDEEAVGELEKALELAPDLQPAQVTLAQIELSLGQLERAENRLGRVLADSPRHAQALSTLGQIYMRQGRRDEARAVARRAREAAIYNLFDDPLMSPVVREGVSSVLILERAKAFFEDGNHEQAALGLERVLRVRPENVEARHLLAISYGNLGQHERSRNHLVRVVEESPEMVDARVQLGKLELDLGRPASAIPRLRRALELAPDDPDAGWLLGRAQTAVGEVAESVVTFERAAGTARAAGRPIPGWAHNEWGAALARTGRPAEALDHFQKALAEDPEDAQALFYVGLIHEGSGRVEEAIEYYCRSMRSQPNPPAAGRLSDLGHACGRAGLGLQDLER